MIERTRLNSRLHRADISRICQFWAGFQELFKTLEKSIVIKLIYHISLNGTLSMGAIQIALLRNFGFVWEDFKCNY